MPTNTNQGTTTYVKTFGGKFFVEVEPDTPGALHRKAESGRDVYYHEYNTVEGTVNDITCTEREWNGDIYRNLNISILETTGPVELQLNLAGSLARCFFVMMENIDFKRPVRFGIARKEKADTLFLSQQNGEGKFVPLKWVYTKDNPGLKPDWKEIMVKGKPIWDNTDEINFFLKILTTEIMPKIADARSIAPAYISSPVSTQQAPAMVQDDEKPVDDLPF